MSGVTRSIPPLVELPEWKSATSAADRQMAAVEWVRRGQIETGYEHVAVLAADGSLLYAGTSGLGYKVRIPCFPDGVDVVLHHSHPGEESLSSADLHVAWMHSRGTEVRAYTPAGSSFAGRSLSNPAVWRSEREAARTAAASELRVLSRRDRRSYAYLAPHLVNAEMEQEGLLWYHASHGSAGQHDLARIASDLASLRALIRRELGNGG